MTDAMDLAFEERGSGPVLLFVHGFPLNRTMWIPQLAGLAKLRTCVSVDLRGHGLSEDKDPSDYSMDLFADDVARTLDGLKADQVDLCGLSMGGYVVFAMLRRHPDRVRSLIFCDTKAEADSPEAKEGRDKTAAAVREKGMEALIEGLLPKLVAPGCSDTVKASIRDMFLTVPPEVAVADLIAMRDRPDTTEQLGSISVPTLWIHGEDDQIMPIEGARATAEKIPGARFEAIPKAGHMAPLENPEPVNAAIAAFLKG